MKPTLQIQQTVALIHVAEKRQKEFPQDEKLKGLINSVVSIVVLYLRHPEAVVTLQQLNIVNRLRNYLEVDNIHTPQENINGDR
jgi:hypothetical protein